MVRKGAIKVSRELKKANYSIALTNQQIRWLNKNKIFNIHKFTRDKLDEYIQLKNKIKELENETTK